MEAREIRIGNYVSCPKSGQNPFRIDEIEVYRSGLYLVGMGRDLNTHPATWYGSDIKPIPLTEDWLIKFGFAKDADRNQYKKGWFRICDTISQGLSFVDLDVFQNDECVWVAVKYVHQLQNLYFALTGEELTIKSNTNDKA